MFNQGDAFFKDLDIAGNWYTKMRCGIERKIIKWYASLSAHRIRYKTDHFITTNMIAASTTGIKYQTRHLQWVEKWWKVLGCRILPIKRSMRYTADFVWSSYFWLVDALEKLRPQLGTWPLGILYPIIQIEAVVNYFTSLLLWFERGRSKIFRKLTR